MQLRGRGDIAATDGHHILIQNGFAFPWADNLLVPAKSVLGCKELDTGEPVRVGLAGDWVTFGNGPWLISLKVNRTARFPKIDDCLPQSETAKSHLTIAPTDAEFLQRSLPGLPCHDLQFEPVTLDLNGRVIIRALGDEKARPSELVAEQLAACGEPIRLNSNGRSRPEPTAWGFAKFISTRLDAPVELPG